MPEKRGEWVVEWNNGHNSWRRAGLCVVEENSCGNVWFYLYMHGVANRAIHSMAHRWGYHPEK